jgi:hypothetical protein
MANLQVLSEAKQQRFEVKVDLDERAFLFPSGKPVSQLVFIAAGRQVYVEAVYAFNASRTPPRLATLSLEDAAEFGHKLVEAVHTARTQLVATEGVRIELIVIANGYRIQFGDVNQATELFLGSNCIWRVCHGILRAVDFISPVEAH